MRKNKNKGFTLIELLAVIVILAIIALIATPIILNVIDKAKYKKEENYCEGELTLEGAVAKKYTIVNDANSNGTADIGDEIAVGEEHFYVISNDGTNINALAKYNLNVGGEYNSGWTAYTNPTGIQDSEMLGYIDGKTTRKGVTAFSSTSQKGTNYSDYNGSIVEGYVNNYVRYLNTNNTDLNATGRLISKEELETLGCSSSGCSCTNAPSWVYSTSYWSGSSDVTYGVWYADSVGYFYVSNYDFDFFLGVRPVITLES